MTLPESVFLFVAGIFSSVGERLLWVKETLAQLVGERREKGWTSLRPWLLRLGAGVSIFLLAVSGISLWWSYRQQTQRVTAQLRAGQVRSQAGLYAAPRVLRLGQGLTPETLQEYLQRAGYRAATVAAASTYDTQGRTLTFHPHPADEVPAQVTVQFANAHIENITIDGVPSEMYRLEPELLAEMSDFQVSQVPSNTLPPMLAAALVASQDPQLLTPSSFGSSLRDVLPNRAPTTASLSAQLAENTTLAPTGGSLAHTLTRWAIEKQLPPAERLALYSSTVFLGQRAGTPVYGVAQGARLFFAKELSELNLAESATLAGLIDKPFRYAPEINPDATREARNAVLAAMLRDGHITREAATQAAAAPLQLSPAPASKSVFGGFAAYAQRATAARLSSAPEVDERTLRVFTTLDWELQTLATQNVTRRLTTSGNVAPQAALVALDAHNGNVLAWVGTTSDASANQPANNQGVSGHSDSQPAALVARRANGILSPLAYAVALEQGVSPLTTFPASAVTDVAANRADSLGDAAPPVRDAGPMMVSLYDGLVNSVDAVTEGVTQRATGTSLARLAGALQLTPPAPDWTATPLGVAGAYTIFANSGQYVAPNVIARLVDARAVNVGATPAPPAPTLTAATAYMMTQMLQSIVQPPDNQTTLPNSPKTVLAGKPGRAGEGWFVGYTPHLVCALWLGNEGSTPQTATGEMSWLVWQDFMRDAVAANGEWGGEQFTKPDDVRLFRVDLTNGQLANGYCEHGAEVALLGEQVPALTCTQHNKDSLLAAENVAQPRLLTTARPVTTVSPTLMPVRETPPAVAPRASVAENHPPATVAPTADMPPVNDVPPAKVPVIPPPAPRPPVAQTAPPALNAPAHPMLAPAVPPLVLPPPILRTRPVQPVTAGRRAAPKGKGLL